MLEAWLPLAEGHPTRGESFYAVLSTVPPPYDIDVARAILDDTHGANAALLQCMGPTPVPLRRWRHGRPRPAMWGAYEVQRVMRWLPATPRLQRPRWLQRAAPPVRSAEGRFLPGAPLQGFLALAVVAGCEQVVTRVIRMPDVYWIRDGYGMLHLWLAYKAGRTVMTRFEAEVSEGRACPCCALACPKRPWSPRPHDDCPLWNPCGETVRFLLRVALAHGNVQVLRNLLLSRGSTGARALLASPGCLEGLRDLVAGESWDTVVAVLRLQMSYGVERSLHPAPLLAELRRRDEAMLLQWLASVPG